MEKQTLSNADALISNDRPIEVSDIKLTLNFKQQAQMLSCDMQRVHGITGSQYQGFRKRIYKQQDLSTQSRGQLESETRSISSLTETPKDDPKDLFKISSNSLFSKLNPFAAIATKISDLFKSNKVAVLPQQQNAINDTPEIETLEANETKADYIKVKESFLLKASKFTKNLFQNNSNKVTFAPETATSEARQKKTEETSPRKTTARDNSNTNTIKLGEIELTHKDDKNSKNSQSLTQEDTYSDIEALNRKLREGEKQTIKTEDWKKHTALHYTYFLEKFKYHHEEKSKNCGENIFYEDNYNRNTALTILHTMMNDKMIKNCSNDKVREDWNYVNNLRTLPKESEPLPKITAVSAETLKRSIFNDSKILVK